MESLDSIWQILENNFMLIPLWKWGFLILFIISFPLFRKFLLNLIKKLKNHFSQYIRGDNFLKYFIPFEIEKPLSWILSLCLFILFIDIMDFHAQLKKYSLLLSEVLLALRIIQLVYIGTDSLGLYLKEKVFKSEGENQIQVLPFFIKTLKVIVVVLGFLISLQNLGINVVSLLAGLGLGGLAVALAAQDTVSNLFGSITILFDKPFKIGDQIKVLDIEGAIEEIGFRSTRIRSINNSLVTIPNSIIAKEKIENLTDRKYRRSKQILTITYETPIERLKIFISELETFLQSKDDLIKDSVTVKFNNFSAHSLDVLLQFDINTNEANKALKIQENIFLDIYHMAQKLKIDFAYPTQKLFIETIK